MTATHDNHPEREGLPPGPQRDAAFDQAMRRLHAGSLDRLAPETVARLRADRRTALSARRSPRPFSWGLAGAAVAVCALAIGASWLRSGLPDGTPPTQVVDAATPAVIDGSGSGTTMSDALLAAEVEAVMAPLDEDPDLYLWLAANDDALPSIMER